MDYDALNEYYRKNPPEYVLDDLGIDHPIHVPFHAKYVKDPCECGIIHKWEKPETFKLDKIDLNNHLITIKKCIVCGNELVLKLYKD